MLALFLDGTQTLPPARQSPGRRPIVAKLVRERRASFRHTQSWGRKAIRLNNLNGLTSLTGPKGTARIQKMAQRFGAQLGHGSGPTTVPAGGAQDVARAEAALAFARAEFSKLVEGIK